MAVILNGKLPDTLLTALPWPEADHLRCRIDAAESLGRLATAFGAKFGKPLLISDGYRTFDQQVALKKVKKSFAATPGTSNHGLGVAIDAASRINVDGSDEHKWMEASGPSFGWINPEWAVNFDSSDGEHEPWHWEYHPHLDTKPTALTVAFKPAPPIPVPEEEDMIIIEAPGLLCTLQGSTLAGIGTTTQADRLTAKGVPRVVYDAAEFARLRQACAGRELIRNTRRGFAVGIPGGRYIPLGDVAEVQFHQAAGCLEREVSDETFANLTA